MRYRTAQPSKQPSTASSGLQKQRPPAFSARKIGGERSYRLARRGVTLELPESDVTVHSLELMEFRFPELVFQTRVSAGTYVRALARDIGEVLGTGAHLTALRREAIGSLRIEQAVSLEVLSTETPILTPRSVLGPPGSTRQRRTMGQCARRSSGSFQRIRHAWMGR